MSYESVRLRRLIFFDAVCREGGIGQAAEAIGLTQPAVSLAIKKLEESFGAVLFERGYGGSDLTLEGTLLHRRVRRMLDQIESAVSELLGHSKSRVHDAGAVCRHLTDAQIRCHIAIAQLGSAADAARKLGISQPAVHRAARELEETVGVTLYRRRVHSVSANPMGTEFARRLSLALNEINQAEVDLASARGQASGQVSVGVLPLLPQRLLARTIGRLQEKFPNVALTIREGAHSRLMNDLRFGDLDIIVGALREPRLEGNVVEFELFTDPYVVVVRRGHDLAGRKNITRKDLTAYGWVVPQKDMPRRAVVEMMMETLPQRPRLVVETSSLAMMMAMLEENDCISLLSRSHILYGNYRNDVVALNIAPPKAERTVGFTTRADWLATQVQQAFIEYLREQCRMDH
ncbi:DNA-binding transcriptional regulator, LysR family [Collimonas sp. OK607]|uniref:LysR substrate-binding domain-containing protein n=1 Tax=Collimonas sp. OK607 TaxID=1798194 RepID=UPI0008EB9B9C|nr:LysR substrate-binding domain-containing protein [Collimonas sp. OK607]SFB28705.1 DNA-binding transcriptional regulator, LysR family [Collimonas sp. OK607]